MDCINGADERNCFQLETNECDPKSEYLKNSFSIYQSIA